MGACLSCLKNVGNNQVIPEEDLQLESIVKHGVGLEGWDNLSMTGPTKSMAAFRHNSLTRSRTVLNMKLREKSRTAKIAYKSITGKGMRNQSELIMDGAGEGMTFEDWVQRVMDNDNGMPAALSKQKKIRHKDKLEFNRDELTGAIFLNEYLVIQNIGRGSFGKVRLVMDLRSNGLRAVKMVNKKTLQMRQMYARVGAGESNKDPEVVMRREIDVMKQLHHDNVVRVHEVIDDPQGTDLLMVLEYVEGGPLIKQRPDGSSDPIAERSARIYFRQVLMGLSYLHSHNVIHGDVKPDNLLLSASGTVKITDFGSAVVLQPGEEDILCRTTGTPAFLAPEVCSGHNFHGKAQDLWALGVSLYAMVYGRLPFRGNTIWDLYERIIDDPAPLDDPSIKCSPELKELLEALLQKDPDKRLDMDQVKDHKWVTGNGRQMLRYASFESFSMNDEDIEAAARSEMGILSTPLPTGIELQSVYYEAGSFLIKQGAKSTDLFILKEGLLEVLLEDETEKGEKSLYASMYNSENSLSSLDGGKSDEDDDDWTEEEEEESNDDWSEGDEEEEEAAAAAKDDDDISSENIIDVGRGKPIHRMASIVETDNEGGQTAIAAAAAGRGFPSQVLEDDNEGKDRSPAPPLAQTSTLPRKSELTAATADREDSQQGSRNLDRAQSQKSGDDGAARSASRRISSTISNLFQSFRSRKSVSLRADGDSKGPSSRTLGEGDDAPNALNKGLGARQAGAAFVQATSSMRKLPLVGEGNGGTADAEDRGQGGASTSYPKEESERNVQSGRTRRKSSGVAKQKASIAAVERAASLNQPPSEDESRTSSRPTSRAAKKLPKAGSHRSVADDDEDLTGLPSRPHSRAAHASGIDGELHSRPKARRSSGLSGLNMNPKSVNRSMTIRTGLLDNEPGLMSGNGVFTPVLNDQLKEEIKERRKSIAPSDGESMTPGPEPAPAPAALGSALSRKASHILSFLTRKDSTPFSPVGSSAVDAVGPGKKASAVSSPVAQPPSAAKMSARVSLDSTRTPTSGPQPGQSYGRLSGPMPLESLPTHPTTSPVGAVSDGTESGAPFVRAELARTSSKRPDGHRVSSTNGGRRTSGLNTDGGIDCGSPMAGGNGLPKTNSGKERRTSNANVERTGSRRISVLFDGNRDQGGGFTVTLANTNVAPAALVRKVSIRISSRLTADGGATPQLPAGIQLGVPVGYPNGGDAFGEPSSAGGANGRTQPSLSGGSATAKGQPGTPNGTAAEVPSALPPALPPLPPGARPPLPKMPPAAYPRGGSADGDPRAGVRAADTAVDSPPPGSAGALVPRPPSIPNASPLAGRTNRFGHAGSSSQHLDPALSDAAMSPVAAGRPFARQNSVGESPLGIPNGHLAPLLPSTSKIIPLETHVEGNEDELASAMQSRAASHAHLGDRARPSEGAGSSRKSSVRSEGQRSATSAYASDGYLDDGENAEGSHPLSQRPKKSVGINRVVMIKTEEGEKASMMSLMTQDSDLNAVKMKALDDSVGLSPHPDLQGEPAPTTPPPSLPTPVDEDEAPDTPSLLTPDPKIRKSVGFKKPGDAATAGDVPPLVEATSPVAKVGFKIPDTVSSILSSKSATLPNTRQAPIVEMNSARSFSNVMRSPGSVLSPAQSMSVKRFDFVKSMTFRKIISDSVSMMAMQDRLYSKQNKTGNKEKVLSVCGPGTVIGEMAAMGLSDFRTASVRCKEDCIVLVITQDNLKEIFEKTPELAEELRRTIASRRRNQILFKTNQKLRALVVGPDTAVSGISKLASKSTFDEDEEISSKDNGLGDSTFSRGKTRFAQQDAISENKVLNFDEDEEGEDVNSRPVAAANSKNPLGGLALVSKLPPLTKGPSTVGALPKLPPLDRAMIPGAVLGRKNSF